MGSTFKVLRDTQRFYYDHVDGSWVPDYLISRGLRNVTPRMGIGYAPPGRTTTTNHLLSLGHSPQDLVDAGVSREGAYGLRDVMSDRLMFSVLEITRSVIGFVGRANPRDTHARKYMNTPTTERYDKRFALHGLGDYRDSLLEGATPLVVEGPMDKLAVDMIRILYGRHDIVPLAVCGTAMTPEHLGRIREWAHSPAWFCFDADAAGQRALLRAWRLTADQGRADQRVVQLPDGQDPASVDHSILNDAIQHAVPMSVAVAQAQFNQWGLPDNWVKAELMVDTLAKRDAARISADDSVEWISTVARLANLPISSVQTSLIEHLAPTPTTAQLEAVRAASFPSAAEIPTPSAGWSPRLHPREAMNTRETKRWTRDSDTRNR